MAAVPVDQTLTRTSRAQAAAPTPEGRAAIPGKAARQGPAEILARPVPAAAAQGIREAAALAVQEER